MPLVPVDLDPYYRDAPDDGLPKQVVHKTDHVQEGKARLIAQYADKPRVIALLAIYLTQIQELEDAFWSILDAYKLDTAVDHALDVLGRIVGVERGGLSDTNFRTLVRAQIKTLRSNGKPNELIEILELAVGGSPTIIYRDLTPPGIDIQLKTPPPGALSPDILNTLLQKAKAGGAALTFTFTTTATPVLFGQWTGARVFSTTTGLANAAETQGGHAGGSRGGIG